MTARIVDRLVKSSRHCSLTRNRASDTNSLMNSYRPLVSFVFASWIALVGCSNTSTPDGAASRTDSSTTDAQRPPTDSASDGAEEPTDVVTPPVSCVKTADCNDDNFCTADHCVKGECKNVVLPDGVPCTGSTSCDSRGSCQAGKCNLGPASTLIDVVERGAARDGTTDDTAVLQNAIDEASKTGATVYLPEGTYGIVPTLQDIGHVGLWIKSNVTICGDGPKSIIKLLGGSDGSRALSGYGMSNVVLRDFAVDGNAASATIEAAGEQRHNIFITRSDHVLVQRMTVYQSMGDGIFLYGGTHSSVVEDCHAYAGTTPNPRVGINFQGANRCWVRGNTVETYQTSYKAEIDKGDPDSVGVVLLGNVGKGPYPLALNGKAPIGRCIDYVVEGNTFEGAEDWTMWIGHAIRTTVRHNIFRGGYSGVYVIFGSENLLVENNRFDGNKMGVVLSNYQNMGASSGVDILNNVFTNVPTIVHVTAPITDVEIAKNTYPTSSTLIANEKYVTNLSVHDNVAVP